MFLATFLISVHACAPSDFNSENMECIAFASSTMELHYSQTGNDVRLCFRTLVAAQWVAFGPGENMGAQSKVVVLSNDRTRSASLTNTDIGSQTNFGASGITSANSNGLLSLCYTLSRDRLIGASETDITTAKFVLAFGDMSGTVEGKHDTANRSAASLDGKVHVPWTIMIHVVFTMVAYLLLYPVGVFAALYASPGFQAGKKFFTIHQTSMYSAVGITVLGIIAVLVFTRARSIIRPSLGMATFHGMLGFLIFLLCLAQPINAYFRVGKDDPRRQRWNLIHKGIGRAAVLLGLGNCIFGGYLFKSAYLSGFSLPVDPFTIAIVFTVLALFAYFALHYDAGRAERKKKKRLSEREQRRSRRQHEANNSPTNRPFNPPVVSLRPPGSRTKQRSSDVSPSARVLNTPAAPATNLNTPAAPATNLYTPTAPSATNLNTPTAPARNYNTPGTPSGRNLNTPAAQARILITSPDKDPGTELTPPTAKVVAPAPGGRRFQPTPKAASNRGKAHESFGAVE